MIDTVGFLSRANSAWANSVAAAINARYAGIYADATARDAEITVPAEGMLAYLTTSDQLTLYVAGAWRVIWDAGAYTTYTPTIVQGATTNIAKTVNHSRYRKSARMTTGEVVLTITGTGTAANTIEWTLPDTPARLANHIIGVGYLFDSTAATTYMGHVAVNNNGRAFFMRSSDAAFLGSVGMTAALANNDVIDCTFQYEATSL